MARARVASALCETARRMGRGGGRGRRGAGVPGRRRTGPDWRRTVTPVRAALALVGTGCLLAGCASGGVGDAAKKLRHTPPTSTSPPPTTSASGPTCPLTGTRAPHGAVPERSALAVKVDNYPTARPQTGLTAADIVFEEPVEGGITRYVAVFQCRGASMVGPVRSARNIDIGILGEFGHPLLVHVGGIQPVIDDIVSSPIEDFELGDYTTSLVQHPPGRVAPYDTYTSTTGVWQLRTTATQPPQQVFSYSRTVPAGTPVQSISIPFSFYSPVVWKYDTADRTFLRYYHTTPDTLANGVQNAAANVVVQFVNVFYGPWLENTDGGLEVQANLATNASGEAIVFRDGVEIQGRWSRASLSQPTSFTTTSGQPIAMQPGTTWVELVPTTVSVTTTP
jgi:Protein of unknown function (DUF3048) N-terminal domain/Protein of unknown function (DUF3048) C-terminal domain